MRSRLGNLAVLLAAVALCYGMMVTKPHYADLIAPIPLHATMLETVTARTFGIHVDKVTFARALQAEHFGEPKLLTTGGVWAIVVVSLSANSTSTTVGEAVWRGPTGLAYRMTERVGYSPGLPPHTIEPGLPKRGLFVFEIPPDQAAGATLLVLGRRFTALDSEARILIDDVPLDDAGEPRDVVGIYDISEPI